MIGQILFVIILIIAICANVVLYVMGRKNIIGAEEDYNAAGSLIDYPEYEEIVKLASKQSSVRRLHPCVTLDNIIGSLTYSSKHPIRPVTHIGQRKLFLNELQFLTNILGSSNKPAIVVYAGASPSNHMYYLHTLFPKVKFLLIDPREFLIYVEGHDKSQYSLPAGIVYLKVGLESHYKIAEKRNIQFYDLADEKIYELNKDTDQDEIKRRNTVYDAHLSDILRYVAKSDNKIFIVEDYFTIAIAEVFAKHNEVILNKEVGFYFWSDIRTRIVEDMIDSIPANITNKIKELGYKLGYPSNVDTIWNSSQQYNWSTIVNADANMLKYKTPYNDPVDVEVIKLIHIYEPLAADFEQSKKLGIDFVANYTQANDTFYYTKGTVYIQPWAPKTSAETRLVTFADAPMVEWDVQEYDSKMFYYSIVQRPFCLHENKHAEYKMCFDLCGDCALEDHIWSEYKQKIDKNFDIVAAVNAMSTITRRNLCRDKHGYLWKAYTREWYNKLGYR